MKRAKCSLCRGKFVVNNYPDHKVRVEKHKIAGKIVCPWCKSRDGTYLIQLRLIAEKVVRLNEGKGGCGEKCPCLGCVTHRVLEKHDTLPARR
jgi:hypothetical protein